MWLEGNEVPKIKKYFRLAQWLSHPNNFYILRKSKSACRSSSLTNIQPIRNVWYSQIYQRIWNVRERSRGKKVIFYSQTNLNLCTSDNVMLAMNLSTALNIYMWVTLISQRVSASFITKDFKTRWISTSILRFHCPRLLSTMSNSLTFPRPWKKIYNPLTFLWLLATTSTVYYPQKSCFNFLDCWQNPSV